MLNNAIYDGLFHPSCSYCSLSLKPCSFTDSYSILGKTIYSSGCKFWCICHCCDGLRIKACCTCLFLLNAVTAAAAAATAAAADVVVVVAAAVAVAAEFGERPRL